MSPADEPLSSEANRNALVSITPLLKRMWPSPAVENVTAEEIAEAVAHIFTDSLSAVQTGALLTSLHFTGWDRRDDVIAKCSKAMRDAAAPIDMAELKRAIARVGMGEGGYTGGLCDIVGTGGDSHNTFNVSTTASIIASPFLLIGKHGNRSATSKSGSADLLESINPAFRPNIYTTMPATLPRLYRQTNYGFLFAPQFHPGMRYVAPIRKQLGWRTIFNLLGPLSNPADAAIEARLVGVARMDLGPVFASALRMAGAKKALVVCGEELLDEISCAGPTQCWRLVDRSSHAQDEEDEEDDDRQEQKDLGHNVTIEAFTLTPDDFGLPTHPLSAVSPGKEPVENARILMKILKNELPPDDPILHFVLINTAALLVVSGVCDADENRRGEGDSGEVIQERGPGGGRWKEGLRRARWAIESGRVIEEWERFVKATSNLG